MMVGLMLAVLLLGATLAGCIGADEELDAVGAGNDDLAAALMANPPDTSGTYSRVLDAGPFDILPVEDVRISSFDGTELAAAISLPDVPEGTQVPIILTISPYWSGGLLSDLGQTGEFYLDNFVAHGYGYATVALRGTSFSDGCMESMGPNEQRDIHEIVRFFAEALIQNVCAAPAEGLAASEYALLTGEKGPFADYWHVRNLRPGVLEKSEGAVFLVRDVGDGRYPGQPR